MKIVALAVLILGLAMIGTMIYLHGHRRGRELHREPSRGAT